MRVNYAVPATVYQSYSALNKLNARSMNELLEERRYIKSVEKTPETARTAKVTTEVRAINRAARRAEGVNALVYEAEDATKHIQSNVQAMQQLAEHAASAELSDEERARVAAEYAHYKEDINEMVRTAAFGETQILDGSLSNMGPQRSMETEGISVRTFDRTQEQIVQQEITMRTTLLASEIKDGFSVDLSKFSPPPAYEGEDISLLFDDESMVESLGAHSAKEAAKGLHAALHEYYSEGVPVDGRLYDVQVEEATLHFAPQVESAERQVADIPTSSTELTVTYTPEDSAVASTPPTESADKQSTSIPIRTAGGSEPHIAYTNTVTIGSRLKVGDVFRLSGKVFELVVPGSHAQTMGASTISIFAAQTNQDVLQAMKDAMVVQFENQLLLQASGNQIQITANDGTADVLVTMQPTHQKISTVTFDNNRLKTGDRITLQVKDGAGDTQENTYIHIRGNTPEDVASILTQDTDGELSHASILKFENREVAASFEPVADHSVGTLELSLGLEGETGTLQVDMQAVNTAGLGLDATGLATVDGARMATEQLSDAEEQLTQQLDNLAKIEESVTKQTHSLYQAAHERIEENEAADAVQAKKLLGNALDEIKQYGNAATIAQANTQPQNVLALLR